jgi:hypothetical protein
MDPYNAQLPDLTIDDHRSHRPGGAAQRHRDIEDIEVLEIPANIVLGDN